MPTAESPVKAILSRREFLKLTGGALSAMVVLGPGCEPETETPTPGASPSPSPEATPTPYDVPEAAQELAITLMVNGEDHYLVIEPRATLATVLREGLGITGSKVVCDRGVCGACTVLLEGAPMLSCSILAVEAVGQAITTIEGLSAGQLTSLQQAFVEKDALQCGFCTSGMVLASSHLLSRNATPTEREVREALSGNLCRCGTYPRIFEAVAAAAEGARRESSPLIGTRVTRLDGPVKVSGQAKYTHDIKLSDMLHAAILRSPHASARIETVDDSVAKTLPGVVALVSFAGSRVRYAGQEVAAVAAETLEQARDALKALQVTYTVYDAVVTLEDAMAPGAPQVVDNRSNVGTPRVTTKGDVAQGLAESEVVLSADFETQVQIHFCLETHSAVAMWEDEKHLTAYYSTQGTFMTQLGLASDVGIPKNNVRILCEYMGGGFGSKSSSGTYGGIVAELSKRSGRPVSLLLDRYGEQTTTGNRPDSRQSYQIGCLRDGTLKAVSLSGYATPGTGSGAGFGEPAKLLYTVPSYRVEEISVATHCGPAATMRAPGYPQGVTAYESLLDDLADEIGMDPLEFRLKNEFSDIRRRAFEQGAEIFDWSRRNPVHGSDPGNIKRGLGLASCIWQSGSWADYEVQVTLEPSGGVTIYSGVQDIGTGTRTYMAMLVADQLGLPLEHIQIKIGDTDYPYACLSAGSTTVPSMAPPTRNAGEKARDYLANLAAAALLVDAETLTFEGGLIKAPDGGSMTFEEACALLSDPVTVSSTYREDPYNDGFTFGVQFAEVDVDVRTGQVRVRRIVAVHSTGTVLNPLTAESQIIGGVIQGLNYALLEERVMDRASGLMLNADAESYKIGGAKDIPLIEPYLLSEDVGASYVGALGLGEPPVIPTAAAIRNAVKNATGARVNAIPITPARVLEALGTVKRSGTAKRTSTLTSRKVRKGGAR